MFHNHHFRLWCLQILITVFEPSTDFEVYSVPEEVCLSRFSLAGLGKQQWPLNVLEEDLPMIQPCLPLSPLKMPSGIMCYIWSA